MGSISRTNLIFGLLLLVVAIAIFEYGHLLRVYTKSVSFLLLDDAEEISYAFTQPSLSSLPSSSSSSTASRKEENHHHVGGHTISGALEEQQHDEQQPAAESRLRSGPTDNVQQVTSTITIPSSQAGAKSPASTETSVGSSIATSGIKHETKEVAAATSIQTHRHQQKLKFDRIYYINLPNAKQRKEFTESWLSLQSNFFLALHEGACYHTRTHFLQHKRIPDPSLPKTDRPLQTKSKPPYKTILHDSAAESYRAFYCWRSQHNHTKTQLT